MFHVHLRRMCILLHLEGKFWRYQLGPFGLKFHLRFVFPYWFCFDNLSIDDSGVLKSPTIIVLLLISPLMPVQFSSVTQSCPTLCNPMDCSMLGLPVHHQLPELAQTHVHHFSDAIQPSHPLLSPSLPVFSLAQHQGFFFRVSYLHQVAQSIGASASASVFPMNTEGWFLLGMTGWISLQSKGLSRVFSNITVQKHQFFSSQLSSQSNSHIHT